MAQRISAVARQRDTDELHYISHPSFQEEGAEALYAGEATPEQEEQFAVQHMPDEVTREHARKMHYAGYRFNQASGRAEAARWKHRYFALRDLVVMGNRKLVFRAVRRWPALANRSDDLIGECYIVLIRAVAVYNPWFGVRFSTYAYTCLIRALSRLAQRSSADRLAHSLPLTSLGELPPDDTGAEEPPSERLRRLGELLHTDHPLLSEREKVVLIRRFGLTEQADPPTLEQLGQALGLSKERVRQVQAAALIKLRKALDEVAPLRRPA